MDDANRIENDAYSKVSLKASYRFPTSRSGILELFAGVNNVAGTLYSPMITVNAVAFGNAEPRYFYPGMPRHYYAGLSWNF